VRTVVHLDPPDNLEAYFQEAGRAGRDGQKAYAVLLWNGHDRAELERQFEQGFPELSEVRQVYRALGSYLQLAVGGGLGESYDFDLGAFASNFRLDPVRCLNALRILQRDGWIEMTEAVFQPAQLQVLVSREALYDYQLKNPRFDPLLKAVLRSYQGVSVQPVALREGQIAAHLRLAPEVLRQYFEAMAQAGIVDYRPQKEKPQLVFLRERVGADNLQLDAKRYAFLRDRQRERLAAMLAYAEEPLCRGQQLLAYFDERDAPPCGRCDVCLHRHRTEPNATELEELRTTLRELLAAGPLRLADLAGRLPAAKRPLLGRALDILADEGDIHIAPGDRVSWVG